MGTSVLETTIPPFEIRCSAPLALDMTMRKFKITGTGLCRAIKQVDPDFKVFPSQISRHRNGQIVHSVLLERILEALSLISPEAKTFYLAQLGNDAEKAVKAMYEDVKPSAAEVIDWTKTASGRELAEVMNAIASRLKSGKVGVNRANPACRER